MGYDVTLHPFHPREFKYFVEEVFDEPFLMDTKTAAIHRKEHERVHLLYFVYDKFSKFKEQIKNENASIEKTIGFAATAILGYLHPYWYLRNGLVSALLDIPEFKQLTSNLSLLVREENKTSFDSKNGVKENYSSGIYIRYEEILVFLNKLDNDKFKSEVINAIGIENLPSLEHCLKYCALNKLDLIEATDLCTPLVGESYTLPANMKAAHLNNISDYTNFSEKNIPVDFSNTLDTSNIDKVWWDNLSDVWRNKIKIYYRDYITPNFGREMAKRNTYVDEKFAIDSLDLSGVDQLEEIGCSIVDREGNYLSLSPLFDFPKLKAVSISSTVEMEFDMKRLLQFPNITKLGINQYNSDKQLVIVNFLALKELKYLHHLALGNIGFKPTELKILRYFDRLKSLSLLFAPYRSVSFLKGNEYLEGLALTYTRGLENLPNLKRLHLFAHEKRPTIKNCPNVILVNCYNAQRMTDLSSFTQLPRLETLIIRLSRKSIDLSLLNEMTSIRSFYVDYKTNLNSINKPVDFIQNILVGEDLKEQIVELAKKKFPNAKVKKWSRIPYESLIRLNRKTPNKRSSLLKSHSDPCLPTY